MNKSSLYILIIAFTFLFSSCQRKNSLSKVSKNASLQEVDFKYFSSKLKIHYQDEEQNFDLTASFRMQKNKVVWMTLLGPFGVKIGKALITKDSVQVLRDFQAKEYYAYSLNEVNNKNNTNLSLTQIQNLLLGNLISTATPTSVKKEDQVQLEQKEGLFKIISTIVNSKIETVSITGNQNAGKIDITYSEYELINKKTIPTQTTINVDHPEMKVLTELQLKNSTFTNDKLSFPFNASSKYVRK